MQNLRKALIVSVGAITILSTSMFMVPLKVGAAAQAGNLIKMNGLSSVYYLGSDGKRYVFPNEATYFSWYSDFSKVVTISQSELESYPLGKNVTIRPGTKLVKITTNPSVYAVTPGGVLLQVPSEAVATTLWGASWAKRVVDVPDAFFTNYTIGSGTVLATAYPAGSLIKYASSADVYYIGSDGKAQKITSEAAFLANGFNWNDIVTAPTAVSLPATGTDIAAAVSTITDTSAGAGGVAYTGGTGLTVSLSGDTAPSRDVPSYSTLVPFVTVNLTASSDGAITVDNLVFTRKGTGAASDFDGGYLYSGDTILSTKRSVNTNDNTITFTALGLTIPAGATQAVTLKMNANVNTTVSGNHYFELASASAVTTEGGATVSGSFPVVGNQMSYSTVAAATITLTGGNNDATQKIGGTQVSMGTFTIGNNNLEDVNVYRVRLRQNSDASDGAVANFSLDLDGTIVKSNVSMVSKYVDFILDTPFLLKKNTTITATVRGDVISDIGKHIQFYLKTASDFDARGSAYGNFYSAYVSDSGTFDASVNNADAGLITIQGSEINVSTDGPAATNVKSNTKQVPLLNVHISSTNTDVLFDDLKFTLTNNAAMNDYNMQNLVLIDSANAASYSVTDPTASSTTNAQTLDFENVYLKKGVQYNFVLEGDIQDNTPANTTFVASLNLASTLTPHSIAHFQDADQTAVSDSDYSTNNLNGKTMTVSAPVFYVTTVGTNAAATVQGATGVLLFKGKFTANDVSDLKVSQMKITAAVGQPTGQNLSKDWQRIYLYQVNSDGSESKLDDENSLDATYVNFSGFTLTVPHGLSNGVYFTVRGDVKSTPTGTSTVITPSSTYSDYNVKDTDSKALIQAQYDFTGVAAGSATTVVTQGTYALSMDTTESGVNADQNVLAGQIIKAGRIKITAANEAALLKDIVIENTGSAYNNTAARAYIYSDSGMTNLLGSADFGDVSDNVHYALVQGLNNSAGFSIPTTGATYLYVGVLVKGVDYSASPSADATAIAGKTIIITVPANPSSNLQTKVWGQASGQLETNPTFSGSSKTSTVYGATMSNITSDFANALLSVGNKDIFSFKVTAPASSNVDYDGTPLGIKLNTVVFSITGSTNVTASSFKIRRTDSGGSGTEIVAYNGSSGTTTPGTVTTSGTATVNFANSYGLSSVSNDLIVKPGTTATYVLEATIGGVSTSYSLQTTIEATSGTPNVTYTHNQGTAGAYTSDTTPTYPYLSGISSVRGGTLSN